MLGMRFKFHLVDSTSVENQLARFLVGGIHSLLDGAVHAGVGLTVYFGVGSGRVGSGHLYMSGCRLVQCQLWLKRCQQRSVYTLVSNKVSLDGLTTI